MSINTLEKKSIQAAHSARPLAPASERPRTANGDPQTYPRTAAPAQRHGGEFPILDRLATASEQDQIEFITVFFRNLAALNARAMN